MESQKIKSLVKLHPEAKEISFRHIYTIQNIFNKNISPLLGIDYFSLMIIDAHNILSVYSNRPSIEFNFIDSRLWMYDGIFETNNHQDNTFYFWDELYAEHMKDNLILEKEKKYGFEFGFYIMKKMQEQFVIYSFATTRNEDRELYRESKDILYNIGDYFFYALKPIHKNYLTNSNLKLVVNNTK